MATFDCQRVFGYSARALLGDYFLAKAHDQDCKPTSAAVQVSVNQQNTENFYITEQLLINRIQDLEI